MSKLLWTLGSVVVVVGCWDGAAGVPTTADPGAGGATLSLAFALPTGAPAVARIVPRGEGVALGLDEPSAPLLPVTTLGLGPVTRATTDPAGAVTLEHADGVEERWRPVALGAEQSWRYARRPDRGAVAVSVSLDGTTLDHADAEALWLRTSTGSLLRYSHATWVGADGARTAVPARWEGDRVRIEVPDELVAHTRFPAVLDPTVSLPINLSPSRAQALPGALATSPSAVLEVGTSTLLMNVARVRASTYGLLTVQALDPAGAPVPGSFRGVPATAFTIYDLNTRHFAAASYGAGVMAVAISQTPGYNLLAARLRPSGEPVDAAPIVVHASGNLNHYPGVACTAAVCLVTWRDGTVRRILARRVGVDGRVLDAVPLVLADNSDTVEVVALADRFVVARTATFTGTPSDIIVSRVMADGTMPDGAGRAVTVAATSRRDVRIATDGSRVFLLWYASASGARPTGWYSQLLDADLASASTLGVHTDLIGVGNLWWDGASYVAGLTTPISVTRLVRFDAAGARLDTTPRTITPGRDFLRTFGVRGGFIALTGQAGAIDTISRYDSLGAQVGASSTALAGYSTPLAPFADSDGTSFLASWLEPQTTGGRTPFQALVRLNNSGAILDAPPVTTGLTVYQTSIQTALDRGRAEIFQRNGSGGSNHVTVDLAARTTAAGRTVLGEPGALVRGGTQRLLLSTSCATRLDASWQPTDPAPVCFASNATFSAADFDGANFVFVYTNAMRASLRRMNADGDILDTPARSLGALGDVTGAFGLAFGAGTHLMAWPNQDVVNVARVAPDGTPGPVVSLGRWPFAGLPGSNPLPVAVVFDGTNFVVAWYGYRAYDIRAARVSPAGAVLDAVPFTITRGAGEQPLLPPPFKMASDGRGSTLFVYSGFDPDMAGEQIRGVFLREDGVVPTDAGVAPADVPAAQDVPRDTGPVTVDVPVVVDVPRDAGPTPIDVPVVVDVPRDAGTPPTDLGGVTDVGSPVDVGGATDAGTTTDSGSLEDLGGAPDATTTLDVPVAIDTGIAIGDVPTDRPATIDAGTPVDAGTTADAAAAVDAGAAADAGAPPDDDGGICDVGGTPGRASGRGVFALLALSLAGLRRRTRIRRAA